MSKYRVAALAVFLCAALAGCAKPPQRTADMDHQPSKTSVNAYVAPTQTASFKVKNEYSKLTGRVLRIASRSDIRLRDKEVVLTFDDGPSPKITSDILAALDTHHVKATFLAVGRMAAAHPKTLQEVALRGHSIGTHTHDHEDLAKQTHAGAMARINAGYRAVAGALAPIGEKPAPFFRFPYLSSTQLLRADLARDNVVVLDVDIDSVDYKKSSPQEVLERTLRRVSEKGKGIILFHDIQRRTAKMLPDFLDALEANGYEVVHLAPKENGLFDAPLDFASR